MLKEFQEWQTGQAGKVEGRAHSSAKTPEGFLFSHNRLCVAQSSNPIGCLDPSFLSGAKNSIYREKIIAGPANNKNKAPAPMIFGS